jgi:hypothetical protein
VNSEAAVVASIEARAWAPIDRWDLPWAAVAETPFAQRTNATEPPMSIRRTTTAMAITTARRVGFFMGPRVDHRREADGLV